MGSQIPGIFLKISAPHVREKVTDMGSHLVREPFSPPHLTLSPETEEAPRASRVPLQLVLDMFPKRRGRRRRLTAQSSEDSAAPPAGKVRKASRPRGAHWLQLRDGVVSAEDGRAWPAAQRARGGLSERLVSPLLCSCPLSSLVQQRARAGWPLPRASTSDADRGLRRARAGNAGRGLRRQCSCSQRRARAAAA